MHDFERKRKLRLQFRHLRGARLGPWCNHGHAVALGAVCRSAKNGRRHSIIQERFIRATTMSTASTTLDPGLCDCLRDVLDPEIGLNIVDLGLVIEARRSTEEVAVKLANQYGFDLREPMDSSIKFCRIAEGSADIYPRHGPTMEWDIAAGHAILEAAGGSVLTPEGQPFAYGKADAGFRNGWFVARGG